MEGLSKDELWEIYRSLPDDIKDAIFSEDTAEAIWNICQINKIEQVSEMAKLAGRTLMGLLPPKDFEQALKQTLKLEEKTAQKIATEMEHYIFNPVKDDLDFIYEEEGKKGRKEIPDSKKEKPSPPSKKHAWEDSYREPIE
jgi:hypothetical protein